MDRKIKHQMIFAVILFFVSLFILLYDEGISFRNDASVLIGYVEKENQHLRRRSSGDLEWVDITDLDKVFSEDLLFTNDRSIAKIRLSDLLDIRMNELTLIKVSKKEDKPSIQLQEGSISLDFKNKKQTVFLTINGEEIIIEGDPSASVSVLKDHGHYKIITNSGKVVVVQNKQEKTLSAGEVLSSENNLIQKNEICEQYLSPIDFKEVKLAENEAILFQWKTLCKKPLSDLEVALDSHFKKILYSKAVQKESQLVILNKLENGPLFWRINHHDHFETHQSFIVIKENTVPEKIEPVIVAKKEPESESDFEPEEDEPEIVLRPMRMTKKTEAKKPVPEVSPPITENVMDLEPLQNTKRWNYSIGAGITNSRYSDGTVSLSQFSITPKLSVSYKPPILNEKVRLSGSAFFTAIPLNTTEFQLDPLNDPSLIDHITIRYLGINLRASYLTPWLKNNWRLEMSAGWYYNSSFVTNDYFGYSSVSGPQIFPSIERDFKNGSSIGSYLKFSPISGNGTLLNITSNYEVALGVYYLLPRKDLLRWSISADLSRLTLQYLQTRIITDNLSLGTSLQF